ncbi:MAG: hypothetical protein ACJ8F3_00720 [Xanthobacteraceae bacterium]
MKLLASHHVAMLATRSEKAQARPHLWFIADQFRRAAVKQRPTSPQQTSGRERLGAALRENLKRRKAQAKARAARLEDPGATAQNAAASHDSAGIARDKSAR